MLTQLFSRLTLTKPICFIQANNAHSSKFSLRLKKNNGFHHLNSIFRTYSKSIKAGEVLTPPKPEPVLVPSYPPKGPRPILPELDQPEELPASKPDPMHYPIPDMPNPAKPSEPSEPLEQPKPNKRPAKKQKPQRKVQPKRKIDPETDPLITPEESPLKQPAPLKEPSDSPDKTKKPKRFRRVRGDRVMFRLNHLNAKQTTAICKTFPFFQSNAQFKFKPDLEAARIEPGKSRGIGRRKSSIAQVKLSSGKGQITINGKPATRYLQGNTFLLTRIEAPLDFLKLNDYVSLTIKVNGGGLIGQADAIKLGISRALCNYNIDYRYPLRNKGYLTRDARVKERKKYGLKKARKAPQYSKR